MTDEPLTDEQRRALDALWDRIGSYIKPVPHTVVESAPFDDHVPGWMRDNITKFEAENPRSFGSHNGKELGLMLSGHKRVANILAEEMDHWLPYIAQQRFYAIMSPEDYDTHIILGPDLMDSWDDVVAAFGTLMGRGLVLGYHKTTMRKFIADADKWERDRAANAAIAAETKS